MISLGIRHSAFGILLLLCGCGSLGTIRYGDGRVGPVPLDPAVRQVAAMADAKAPGSGALIRQWFEDAGADKIPAGYKLRWRVLDEQGNEVDLSRLRRVPELVPTVAAPAAVSLQDLDPGPIDPDAIVPLTKLLDTVVEGAK
jgi:hypothetical protein